MVILTRCSFVHEAYLIKANLESAGIEVEIQDEHTVNMDWFYSNALGGVKVLVPEADVDFAQELLKEDYSQEVEELYEDYAEDTCPTCGSPLVKSDERASTGKTLKNIILFILFWPILFWLKYKQDRRALICQNCELQNTEMD